MMQMMFNSNAVLLSLLTRHQFAEQGTMGQLINLGNQARMTGELTEQIKKIADNSTGGRGGGKVKPVSEYKAVQQLKMF